MGWFDENGITNYGTGGYGAQNGITTGQNALPRDLTPTAAGPDVTANGQIDLGQGRTTGTGGASGGVITPTTGSTAPTLNRQDPASVAAYVQYYANQPGANPSLARDPQYWIGKISSGELGDDPNYIVGKFMQPEGAPAGQGGSLGSLGGQNPTGFGGYLAPFTDQFSAPTAAQAEAQPGYQFARDQGLQAIDRSAAAKGTLLTGGNLKDLAGYAGGVASQNYNSLYNQSANTFGINQSTFYHNQDAPYQKLLNLSSLGKPTTP